jgi:hypothetical protein
VLKATLERLKKFSTGIDPASPGGTSWRGIEVFFITCMLKNLGTKICITTGIMLHNIKPRFDSGEKGIRPCDQEKRISYVKKPSKLFFEAWLKVQFKFQMH